MVNQLARHEAKWLAPAPLWNRESMIDLSSRNGSAWRPSILRFDNDLFMDEALAALAYYPDRLPEWIARPETWEQPMERPRTALKLETIEPVSEQSKKIKRLLARKEVSATDFSKKDKPTTSDSATVLPFKLYQPAHQRYYLVAASLICHQQGMPDRRVDPGRQESTHFVLRRVIYTGSDQENEKQYDPTDPAWKEYAFVADPAGFAWKLIEEKRDAVQTGEDRLPLFSLHYNEIKGNRRRVLAGLIPVGKREGYLSAPVSPNKPASPGDAAGEAPKGGTDPRRLLFEAKVTGPWGSLVEQAKMTSDHFNFDVTVNPFPNFDWDTNDQANAAKDKVRLYRTSREQIQTISWYVLLDFAKFLKTYLPDVLANIADPGKVIEDPDDARLEAKRKLVDIVSRINVDAYKNELTNYFYDRNTEVKRSLSDALLSIVTDDMERKLESVDVPYLKDPREHNWESWNPDPDPKSVWPTFLFPLADPGLADPRSGPIPDIDLADVDEANMDSLDVAYAKIDALAELIEQALPATKTPPPEIKPPALPLAPGNGWFVIRCVYERPNCGPLHPAVVSEPTEKFQMASFFDPDAPARPVRISLPMDISPAGLRKFKKNATLMMSDMLCGKVGEIKKLTFADLVLSVLPWPFHKDLPNPDNTGPCKKGEENAGMYCSLSIPIVTLAALILMIIIVSLFDMFFKWVPYLFTCFPIPGFKGKKA